MTESRAVPSRIRWVLTRTVLGRRAAEPLTAFVHIPKTAGGTVITMLESAYSAEEIADAGNYLRYPETTEAMLRRARWTGAWRGARLVVGHVPYGLLRTTLPPGFRCVTFLREPVDRVLSHFYRHVQRKEGIGSLEEALELRVAAVENLATRFLCGDPSPLDELRAGALEDAKANLREFLCVGVQERFEESVVLLQRSLGLGLVPYLNEHVSVKRPAVAEISSELRSRIEQCNELDVELYQFGRELFENAVATADDGFAADVKTLRALSADANKMAIQAAGRWLEEQLPPGTARPRDPLFSEAEAAGIPRSALRYVIDRSSLRKAKGRGGERLLTAPRHGEAASGHGASTPEGTPPLS